MGKCNKYKEKENKLLINHIYYPVKTLGFRNRIGIWFQGCSIHCPGCMSKYTWAFDPKYSVSYNYVSKKLSDYKRFKPYGITISGGEPFDQPLGLFKVLEICKQLKYKEIMVYSGYTFIYLYQNYSKIISMIDLLITEPFIESLPTNKIWRGSDNQKIYLISKQAKRRYKDKNLDSTLHNGDLTIQIEISDNSLFIIGIPKRGDLGRLEKILKDKGVKIWVK